MKTIRKKINILLGGVAVMAGMAVVSGCSSGDDDLAGGKNVTTEQGGEEMRFSAEVGTRVYVPEEVDYIFQDGDSVKLWVDDCQTTEMDMATATPKAHVGCTAFSVNTSDNTLTQRRGAALKYPTSGNRVNIYAMRVNPSVNIADRSALPTTSGNAIVHSVLTNQNTVEKYCQSDLMYGELKYQKHTTNMVSIPFKHVLAKITVIVGSDNPSLQRDLSRAQILGTITQAKIYFNRSKGYGLSSLVIEPYGAVGDIDLELDGYATMSAVIIPQTIVSGSKIFKLQKTKDGVTTTYTYKLAQPMTFESGKEYVYTIRTSADLVSDIKTIKVSEVKDWINTDFTGDAHGYKN